MLHVGVELENQDFGKNRSLKTPITIQCRTFIITEDYESKESHIKISGRIHLPLPAKL